MSGAQQTETGEEWKSTILLITDLLKKTFSKFGGTSKMHDCKNAFGWFQKKIIENTAKVKHKLALNSRAIKFDSDRQTTSLPSAPRPCIEVTPVCLYSLATFV
jgi:hypothetical protein